MAHTHRPLRLGTRGSKLALAQAYETKAKLEAAHPDLAAEGRIEVVEVKTTGDIEQKRRLAEIGGKGLFTKELEDALRDGRVDVAVHSMKDVPTWIPEGLEIPVILPREDPRDAWFCDKAASISELPAGATVGTSSLRRQAQVMALRPDVSVVNFRGNLQTRLQKLRDGQVDATMLALAGLRRMGIAEQATAILSTDELLPAVAQGAIGLEMRADDEWTRGLISAIDDSTSRLRVMTERACLEELQGSCQTPIGVLCEFTDAGQQQVRLRALLAEPDGSDAWRAERAGPLAEADALARDAGRALRASAGEDFFERHADLF